DRSCRVGCKRTCRSFRSQRPSRVRLVCWPRRVGNLVGISGEGPPEFVPLESHPLARRVPAIPSSAEVQFGTTLAITTSYTVTFTDALEIRRLTCGAFLDDAAMSTYRNARRT